MSSGRPSLSIIVGWESTRLADTARPLAMPRGRSATGVNPGPVRRRFPS